MVLHTSFHPHVQSQRDSKSTSKFLDLGLTSTCCAGNKQKDSRGGNTYPGHQGVQSSLDRVEHELCLPHHLYMDMSVEFSPGYRQTWQIYRGLPDSGSPGCSRNTEYVCLFPSALPDTLYVPANTGAYFSCYSIFKGQKFTSKVVHGFYIIFY